MSQQELIDLAIASYLKTNDNTARQYLRLRQEALELTQHIRQEVLESGSVSAETSLKLQKLKFEHAKSSVVYNAYLDTISSNFDIDNVSRARVSVELDERYDALLEKKKAIDSKTDLLRKEHKPVVEKMKLMAASFERGVSVRSDGAEKSVKTFSSQNSVADEKSIFLDYASTVFTKQELDDHFTDVKSKLASLKTVDEIDDDVVPEEENFPAGAEKAPAINVTKYLDEFVQSSQACLVVGDSSYHFGMTKSTSPDLGGPHSSISDYEKAIDTLTREIQGTVVHGAEAKERWISNAQKIEMIHALLEEDKDMEIDG